MAGGRVREARLCGRCDGRPRRRSRRGGLPRALRERVGDGDADDEEEEREDEISEGTAIPRRVFERIVNVPPVTRVVDQDHAGAGVFREVLAANAERTQGLVDADGLRL